jgi:hypothetical protein
VQACRNRAVLAGAFRGLEVAGMSSANITHMGVDLVVEYEYSPAEAAQHYGDAPYPGCPEYVEVTSVKVGDSDIYELLDASVIEALESEVLEDRYGQQQQAEEDRAEARWDQDRIAEGDYL